MAERNRRFCFTLNNYTEEEYEELKNLRDVKYIVIGKEVGENGTPHLQGFVVFKNMKSFNQVRLINGRAHWEITVALSQAAADYCKKDQDFVEIGSLGRQGERNDLKNVARELREGSTIGEVAHQFPCSYIKYHSGIKNYALLMHTPYNHTDVRGLWIQGPPGTGKSRYARTFESLYLKSQNKWWDAYDGHDVVLMDDFDKQGQCLGHHLKIWSDRYACTGETKGGTVCLSHKLFIVTSNYSISDLFGEDDVLCQAIRRRFIVLDFGLFRYVPLVEEIRTWEVINRVNGEIGMGYLNVAVNLVEAVAPEEHNEIALPEEDEEENEFEMNLSVHSNEYNEWLEEMGLMDAV